MALRVHGFYPLIISVSVISHNAVSVYSDFRVVNSVVQLSFSYSNYRSIETFSNIA